MGRQTILTVILLLIALAGSLFLAFRIFTESSLTVQNQAVEESVRVSLRLGSPKGGFLVIFKVETGIEDDWLQIALTDPLRSGTYANMVIPVPEDAEASGSALAGASLMAYLVEDSNGNGVWDATDKRLAQQLFQDTRSPQAVQ